VETAKIVSPKTFWPWQDLSRFYICIEQISQAHRSQVPSRVSSRNKEPRQLPCGHRNLKMENVPDAHVHSAFSAAVVSQFSKSPRAIPGDGHSTSADRHNPSLYARKYHEISIFVRKGQAIYAARCGLLISFCSGNPSLKNLIKWSRVFCS
jgi:hypothetical protein